MSTASSGSMSSPLTRPPAGGGPVASPESDFDRREAARLAERVAAYNHIAEWRAERVSKHHYYSEQIRNLVSGLVLPGGSVLEVGCGALGDLLAVLEGPRRVGIDLSPRMIEIARARHPELDLRIADAERGPLPEGPFDPIVLSDTIGHFGDIEAALERLKGLLAPNGRIVITYYNFVWEPALEARRTIRAEDSMARGRTGSR